MTDLTGRIALVTGATSGIGLECAADLARMGARVGLVGRNAEKTASSAVEVKRRVPTATVDTFLCDFSRQADIRRLAGEVLASYDHIHILVNNAGTVSATRTVTDDGIETTFAVNHLGYYLLTRLLLDRIVASAPARIVNVASVGHYRGTLDFDDLGLERNYEIFRAYTRSKLCNVLFTRRLAAMLDGTGVTVNALHPGTVATSIWGGAPRWAAPVLTVWKWFMDTPATGGARITYVATSPEIEGKTGLYFDKNQARTVAALARDDTLAQRLWDESGRLVGMG